MWATNMRKRWGDRARKGHRKQTYIASRKEITWKQNEPEAVISHTVRRREYMALEMRQHMTDGQQTTCPVYPSIRPPGLLHLQRKGTIVPSIFTIFGALDEYRGRIHQSSRSSAPQNRRT